MSTINGLWFLNILIENNSSSVTNFSNSTETKYTNWSISFTVVLVSLYVVIMILSIGGNAMVLATILRHKGMRTRTNMFIASLSVGDLLTSILVIPFSPITLISGTWKLGRALCNFNGFTISLFIFSSIHLLMYISIHKYISITKPFSRFMTKRRILYMIAAAWFWAGVISIGPMLGWNKIEHKKGTSQCGPQYPTSILQYTHSGFVTLTGFIIPFIVMTKCYYGIFKEIREHMKRMRDTTNIDHDNSINQQRRITITLMIVLVCFLMCWLPYIIYSSWSASIKDKKIVPIWVNPIAYWCGFLNSACNPIIYAFRSPSFRQGYKEIMCGKSDYPHSIGDDTIVDHSPSGLRRLWTFLGTAVAHGSRRSSLTASHRNSVNSVTRGNVISVNNKHPTVSKLKSHPGSPNQIKEAHYLDQIDRTSKENISSNQNCSKDNKNDSHMDNHILKNISIEAQKTEEQKTSHSDVDSSDELFYSVDETKDDVGPNVNQTKTNKTKKNHLNLLIYSPPKKSPLLAQASVDILDVPNFLHRKGKSETYLDNMGTEDVELILSRKCKSMQLQL